jgi:hypothetical protein
MNVPRKELAAFRLPPRLLVVLRQIKQRDHISITDQVIRALEMWVEERDDWTPGRKRIERRKRR